MKTPGIIHAVFEAAKRDKTAAIAGTVFIMGLALCAATAAPLARERLALASGLPVLREQAKEMRIMAGQIALLSEAMGPGLMFHKQDEDMAPVLEALAKEDKVELSIAPAPDGGEENAIKAQGTAPMDRLLALLEKLRMTHGIYPRSLAITPAPAQTGPAKTADDTGGHGQNVFVTFTMELALEK